MELILNEDIETNDVLVNTKFPLSNNEYILNKIPSGNLQHLNYLYYLEICWKRHYNAVIKPDYIWQIILCEFANHIKNNSEKYRKLFTDSNEKKDIVVNTIDPVILPIDSVVKKLIDLIPFKNVKSFIPKFSTTNDLSILAFSAAFCDAMSPYYNYGMFLCGIPKIKIEGTKSDWELLQSNFDIIVKELKLNKYKNKVNKILNNIINSYEDNDIDFFKNIIKMERCGSGSQHTVNGWIKDLYIDNVDFGLTKNYPSCVSNVEYKNLTTNKEYIMNVGLFSSQLINGYLTPEFSYVIYDKK